MNVILLNIQDFPRWKKMGKYFKKNRWCGIRANDTLLRQPHDPIIFYLVRKERLELSRREALEPKSSASTNSATFARARIIAPLQTNTLA